MSDMACVYEMNSLAENEQLDKDILVGKGLEVLFCLMDGLDRAITIAQKLGMPIYSVQLYIQRLIKAGLVSESVGEIRNCQIEKKYQLVSDEIEIRNQIQAELLSEAERQREATIAAQHFSTMVKDAIKRASKEKEKPSKIRTYFMKAQKENMLQFRKEIDDLYQKYQENEDLQAEDTYSLFTVLAPYEMEE